MNKKAAIDIFMAGVDAVKPGRFIPELVKIKDEILQIGEKNYELGRGEIIVTGGGKAAAQMALELEKIMGKAISRGLVVTKTGHSLSLERITCLEAAHPVPDEAGVRAAGKIKELVSGLHEKDLVICLISGGASALIADIPDGIPLAHYKQLARLLLESGASIQEINVVRKKLSTLKGGKLAELCSPATVVAIILSDVIGDPLESIASGLTVADSNSFEDAKIILKKYGLLTRLPESIINFIEAGIQKENDNSHNKKLQVKATNILAATNRIALQSAYEKAISLGYNTEIITHTMTGEAREKAKEIIQHAMQYRGRLPACLLYGGETTVTIKGSGKGGRNQELALAALMEIEKNNLENLLLLSAGTDGTDGPTDATGAIASLNIAEKATAAGLNAGEYLTNNDAYTFFKQLNELLITGPTQTNVMDLVVVISGC